MSQAGKALDRVLRTHDITQYKLAAVMQVSRSNVHRWRHSVDPAGDTILAIRDALQKISPDAAAEFIRLYLEGTIEESP